jgi:hypothetical protein
MTRMTDKSANLTSLTFLMLLEWMYGWMDSLLKISINIHCDAVGMKKIELKNRNRTELCLLGSTIQTADLRLLEVMSDFMKTSKANRDAHCPRFISSMGHFMKPLTESQGHELRWRYRFGIFFFYEKLLQL